MIDDIPCAPQAEQQQIAYAAEAAALERYYQQFEALKNAEDWNGIVTLGEPAITAAMTMQRSSDAARIHAQLASTYFYKGEYYKTAEHADRCRELSAFLADGRLLVRSQYLQSAAYRALAGKAQNSQQKYLFDLAVASAQGALRDYNSLDLNDVGLIGKVYFNLGAAYADNPSGDWDEAALCYDMALKHFRTASGSDGMVRTAIRLARIKLLKGKPQDARALVAEVRPQISSERVRMQLDFLEAQIALVANEPDKARQLAQKALDTANKLGAKEDTIRLQQFLKDNGG